VSRYQKGKTDLDFTGARDSEWQWHQLDHMEVCTSLQTDNHARTPPLSFLQAGCPSCRPTTCVEAPKAIQYQTAGEIRNVCGQSIFEFLLTFTRLGILTREILVILFTQVQ